MSFLKFGYIPKLPRTFWGLIKFEGTYKKNMHGRENFFAMKNLLNKTDYVQNRNLGLAKEE